MDGNRVLNLEMRRKIYNYISENPGLHLREISRKIDVPKSTLKYHLNHLEKNGLILKSEEGYSRYYIPNQVGRTEKKLIGLFKKDMPLLFAIVFLVRQCMSRMEFSKDVNIPPNTVNYYLKKFQKLGIIEPAEYTGGGVIVNWKKPVFLKREQITTEVVYRLKEPYPFLIYNVLIKYKNCFSEFYRPAIDAMEGGLWDLRDGGLPRDQRIKIGSNLYFELFPIPFCDSDSFF